MTSLSATIDPVPLLTVLSQMVTQLPQLVSTTLFLPDTVRSAPQAPSVWLVSRLRVLPELVARTKARPLTRSLALTSVTQVTTALAVLTESDPQAWLTTSETFARLVATALSALLCPLTAPLVITPMHLACKLYLSATSARTESTADRKSVV